MSGGFSVVNRGVVIVIRHTLVVVQASTALFKFLSFIDAAEAQQRRKLLLQNT